MWAARLKNNYATAEEWIAYSEMYGLAERLGYDDPMKAWEDNPMIQGSTNPDDFKVVESATKKFLPRNKIN